MKIDISCSVWRPWRTATAPNFISIEDQVKAAIAVQADAIAIKGVNGTWIYGAKENLSWIYNKYSNDHMEQEAKAQGLEVDLWCWVDCQNPAGQAQAIKDAVARWNPRNVKLDVEGGVAKKYAYNTGAFLRSLGRLHRHDGIPVKVWLQSYRRPDVHPEIAWNKWLSYIGQDGLYLLEGVAPQAYYAGTQDSVSDYARMLIAYDKLESETHRTLNWHVTLPTYRENGWQPTADSLEAGIGFLRNELGDRLVGVDFFRLGWLMNDRLADIYSMLLAYDWGEEEAEPEPLPDPPDPSQAIKGESQPKSMTCDVSEPEPEIPFEQQPEPERWKVVGDDLRYRGVIYA